MAIHFGIGAGLANTYSTLSWTRSGSTITVTHNSNPLSDSGTNIKVTVSSDTGAIPLGYYNLTTWAANSFTITGVDTGAASGTLTYQFTKQYITTASITTTTQNSYSMWFYAYDSGNNMRFFDANSGASGQRRMLFTGGSIRYAQQFTTTSGGWDITGFALNTWNHLVVTYDGSNTSNIPIMYLNGVSRTVTTGVAPVGTNSNGAQQHTIANRVSNYDRNWDGKLAEFAYWNRILDAGEVSNLALGAKPSRHLNGLLLYLPLMGHAADRINATAGTVAAVSGFTSPNFNTDHPRMME